MLRSISGLVRVSLALTAVASAVSLCAVKLGAATLTVALNGGEYTDIQSAIDDAMGGDTVLVKPGEYLIDAPISFKGKAITVKGEAGAELTTIRMSETPKDPARGSVVIFENREKATSVLEGLTLTGGKGTYIGEFDLEGGGVFCKGDSSPTVARCTISVNRALSGGWTNSGVSCIGGSSPTFQDCSILENSQGFCVSNGSRLTVKGCRISGNLGTGIYCFESSLTAEDCTISDNRGPGLVLNGPSASLSGCVISGNLGTGLRCDATPASVRNCAITGNSQAGVVCYGDVLAGTAAPKFSNCTIAGNAGQPYGVHCTLSKPAFTNCIVWANGAGSVLLDEESQLLARYSLIEGGWSGTGNMDRDPLFCGFSGPKEVYVDASALPGGDGSPGRPFAALEQALEFSYALSSGSPCIGAGQDGADMGSPAGNCDAPGEASRIVHLARGIYRRAAGFNLYHHVSLEGDGPDGTVIEGRILGLRTGSRVSGVTVSGGGIDVGIGESPEVTDIAVSASPDTGIVCGEGSSPRFTRCAIRGNGAPGLTNDTGGVLCARGSSPAFTRCAIEGNTGWTAAGVYCYEGSKPVFDGCVVARNVGGRSAVYCEGSSATFRNCSICENASPIGVHSSDEGLETLETFIHCTIAANAGVGVEIGTSSASNATRLVSCIVWGNQQGSGTAWDEDSEPTATFSSIEGETVWPGKGNIHRDPLFCGRSGAQEVYVDASGAPGGDGSPAKPFAALGQALEFSYALSSGSPCLGAAEGGGDMGAPAGKCEASGGKARLVRLAGGTYTIEGSSLFHGVSLEGAGEAETVVEGTLLGLETGSRLSGLTITRGALGGVIVGCGQSFEIADCSISGNNGAGVQCIGPQGDEVLRVTRCTISGNAVAGILYSGNLMLRESRIAGNGGGAVACGTGTFIDCSMTDNRGPDWVGTAGYAVNCNDGTFVRCTIARNGTDYSWFGAVRTSSASFVDCAIVENQGFAVSSWRQDDGASLAFTNCTISGNSVSMSNGGPLGTISVGNGGSITLTNCIVWDNKQEAIKVRGAGQVLVTHSCMEGEAPWPGEGNTNRAPLFVRQGSYDDRGTLLWWGDDVITPGDYRLTASSPCIDTGLEEGAPPVDLDGNGRPCGAGVDMGAYESGGCVASGEFLRGDTNADGRLQITDAICLLGHLFQGGERPGCKDSADADDNGAMNITDAIAILGYLFLGAGPLAAPFGACGTDPTPDDLGCASFEGCP